MTTDDSHATDPAITADLRVDRAGLQVADTLVHFVENELLPGLDLPATDFWEGAASLIATFLPQTQVLLRERVRVQALVDEWHHQHGGTGDLARYEAYLEQIGYLEEEPAPVPIDVPDVDPEIACTAAPQLVVPLSNARYALNAANARWGSLYDALYGTDAIPEGPETARTEQYNPRRGTEVIARANELLDQFFPLQHGSFDDATALEITEGSPNRFIVRLADGSTTALRDESAYEGFQRDGEQTRILLRHNGLGVQLVVDPTHSIGQQQRANIADVALEAALTTIADCEDSVAAVDAHDKVEVYRTWLGLMTGSLNVEFAKDGQLVRRSLEGDRTFTAPDGSRLTCHARSLLLARIVGLHMKSDAVLTDEGVEIPEGILDALITVAASAHDLARHREHTNSHTGSIYLVVPKLHGTAEVAHTVALIDAVEQILGIPTGTVKLGIMDEERRTSLNLTACINAAQRRIIFVNTGFLDRTGDEIHTMRAAGPVLPKGAMRDTSWFQVYEKRNVERALAAGFAGHAQIGKGMWAKPEAMAEMLASKIEQPRAGGSCGWVPSPTAATLHALHYHWVDVSQTQMHLAHSRTDRRALLELPLMVELPTPQALLEELRNNAQGILGYVVRWVENGVGCSKVPDIQGIELMEDRATLRISSQHIANWLHHGLVERDTVIAIFHEMAALVDDQNRDDPSYRRMAVDPAHSRGFRAALDLVFEAFDLPNGYTENTLAQWRRLVKRNARTGDALGLHSHTAGPSAER